MRTKGHIPLWTKILLLAALNLAILGGVFIAFLRSQLKPELDSFFMAEARERIGSVTRSVATELEATDASLWSSVLRRYSAEHGLTILLYRNTGEQLAGMPTALPPDVDMRMPRGGPPPGPRGEARGSEGGREPPPGGPASARERRDPPRGGPRGGGPSQSNSSRNMFLVVTPTSPQYWVGVLMPIIDGPNGEPMRSVLMLVSPTFFTNPFFFEFRPWLGIGAAAVFISALCWLPLMRNLTGSIADMMRATGRIAEGRFDVEVKTERRDELGRLGTSIKQMAGRLESLTEGRRRFLGAVAHELRSPIARMQLATEILERNAVEGGQKYIDYLKDDIQTMSRLTDELLQLARAESAPGPVQVQPTNIAAAVETAVHRESIEGADIRVSVDPSLQAQANMDYLVRALANVLRNALHYAGDQGPITITATRSNDEITITVTDSGPGVPEDALDKIFTPFYRVDDARDRRTGGTGLGLAIVRSCIEACGGKVECRNHRPTGLEIVISLRGA